jgi:type IV pilus assembly protein PilA
MNLQKQEGFSLIELLIVVAIILIIAAIAVPNLIKAKMTANESAAAAAERTVSSANVTYSSMYNQGFAGSLAQLGPTSAACAVSTSACADLIDSALSGINPLANPPVRSHYVFTYVAANAAPAPATPNNTYSLMATPVSPGPSGKSTFCLDQTNVIKKDASGVAQTAPSGGCDTFASSPM